MSYETRSESRGELRGWKAIAGHLDVTPRTAQLWEKNRNLPVQRLPGGRGAVFVRVEDLDRWRRSSEQTTAGVADEPRPANAAGGSPRTLAALGLAGAVFVILLASARAPSSESIFSRFEEPFRSFEFTDPNRAPFQVSPSPDGRWIAYIGGHTGHFFIQLLDTQTGMETTLVEGLFPYYLSWSPDGKSIVFRTYPEGAVYVVSADGGEPVKMGRYGGTMRGVASIGATARKRN